jgi:hypothetical protein
MFAACSGSGGGSATDSGVDHGGATGGAGGGKGGAGGGGTDSGVDHPATDSGSGGATGSGGAGVDAAAGGAGGADAAAGGAGGAADAGAGGSGGAAAGGAGGSDAGVDMAADASQPEDAAPETGGGEDASNAETGVDAGTDTSGSDDASDAAATTDAGGLTCPTTINGSLDTTDMTQTGRVSRIVPVGMCGAAVKPFPGNGADPTNPHLVDVYHFANPTAASVCFNFTLTYPQPDGGTTPQLYMAAYTPPYNPANITTGYLADVGNVLNSPQTMGLTLTPGMDIDVIVYALGIGNAGVGPYTLSCTAQ